MSTGEDGTPPKAQKLFLSSPAGPSSSGRLPSEADSGIGSLSRPTVSEDTSPPSAGVSGPPLGVCLRDWKGSRVLAKPPGYEIYLPGSISYVQNDKDIAVKFDTTPPDPTAAIMFVDVVDAKFADVIADQAPAPGEVKIGMIVVARQSSDNAIWRSAEVVGVSVQPVSFQVRFWDPTANSAGRKMPTPESVWVSRANLRLLRPPWFDEM